MGRSIHRNGDQYREWSSIVDCYVTEPMSRDEMLKHLKDSAIQDLLARVSDEIEERLERADKNGTSSYVSTPRDATKWETEICQKCGSFHHAFVLRESDGNCRHCGEPLADRTHNPPCPSKETHGPEEDPEPARPS